MKIFEMSFYVDYFDVDVDCGTRYFTTFDKAKAAMDEVIEEYFIPEIDTTSCNGAFSVSDGVHYAEFTIKEYEVEG